VAKTDADPSTKQERIVGELRRVILSGEYPRGARLAQDELATRFGVSITPVREALRVLHAEGLVESWPNRGVRVAGVDLDRLTAVYVQRRLAESFAMRRAATRMSRRDLAAAARWLDTLDDCTRLGDAAGVRSANENFHFECLQYCGLPHLTTALRGLWASFPWDLTIGDERRSAASRREHLEIMRALRAGNGDRVAVSIERHLAGGFRALTDHLGVAAPDPFDTDR
jgi:DNA-binding GntR family transcriptional regulator